MPMMTDQRMANLMLMEVFGLQLSDSMSAFVRAFLLTVINNEAELTELANFMWLYGYANNTGSIVISGHTLYHRERVEGVA